jgi:hypothetical protein
MAMYHTPGENKMEWTLEAFIDKWAARLKIEPDQHCEMRDQLKALVRWREDRMSHAKSVMSSIRYDYLADLDPQHYLQAICSCGTSNWVYLGCTDGDITRPDAEGFNCRACGKMYPFSMKY